MSCLRRLISSTEGLGYATGAVCFYPVDTISSGSLLIDHALGINGFPRGRMIEIYGPESSGKTTLALHALLKLKRRVAFVHL